MLSLSPCLGRKPPHISLVPLSSSCPAPGPQIHQLLSEKLRLLEQGFREGGQNVLVALTNSGAPTRAEL